jgi:hypothetical protein
MYRCRSGDASTRQRASDDCHCRGVPWRGPGDVAVSQRLLFDISGQEVGTLIIRAVVIRVFDGVDNLIALHTKHELKAA